MVCQVLLRKLITLLEYGYSDSVFCVVADVPDNPAKMKGRFTMARTLMKDVHRDAYFQMPKFLFAGEFKTLSNDARVLYALLKERHELSIKNNWVNEKGEIYHVYSREDMGDMLNLSQPTVRNVISELKETKLLEEERPGQGKLNRLFLIIPDNPQPPKQTEKNLQSEKSPKNSDCKNSTVCTEEQLQSKVKQSSGLLIESKNFTFSSEEEKEKIKDNLIEPELLLKNQKMQISAVVDIENTVKQQIGYDKIISEANQYGYETSVLDTLVAVMVDVFLFTGDYIVLSKTKVLTSVAQREFRKIFSSQMIYQIKRLAQNPNKVSNETVYLRTCLYNLPRNYEDYRARYYHTGNAA